ncbi:hypothetical protein [Synechococcus sp. PCC 7336]|uniref:hypothetical protein n=1 Tax=Synechococcus sp. PCC 7336 TaxID=195250 RepID=UPI000347E621|nr:hypothetical protein [Synechococcus sp. PCC 7336]
MLASVKTLLSSVVDYAGLFPPAQLDLQQAMDNYARYRRSEHCWMLGRFVLPISRLQDFEDRLSALGKIGPIALSGIVSKDWELDLERIQSGDRRDRWGLAALEFPPLLKPADIQSMLPRLPKGIEAFFEIPCSDNLDAYISVLQGSVLQGTGAAAKLRLGGVNREAFPSAKQVCQVVLACAAAGVPFKATAGLHHPLPAQHALPDGSLVAMHGFLNLAISAALACGHEVTAAEARAILHEVSIDRFHFSNEWLSWGDRPLALSQVGEARQRLFRSFGSCSFEEPVEDLKELKLL